MNENWDALELAIANLIGGLKDKDFSWISAPEPFYGCLLASLPHRYCTEESKDSPWYVDTAAVMIRNNKVNLIINREFFNELDVYQQVAVVKHEAQHIAHRHLFRAGLMDGLNPKLSNIAMDAVINQFNPLSDRLIGAEVAHFEKPLDPVQWSKIDGAVADQTWKGYYDLLEKDQMKNGSGEGDGQGGGQGDGEGKGGGEGDLDGKAGDLSKYGDVIDDHSHFGRVLDDSNLSIVEERLKNDIQRTARGLNPGSLPQEIQQILDDIVAESKVPWRSLLRNWIKTSVDSYRGIHPLRESISVAGVFPGFKRIPRPEYHVYADMSGSISDVQATAFFCEVLAIQRKLKAVIHLHQFDTKVHSSELIEKKVPSIQRNASGGTNFECCVEHARKNKTRNFIIMTDGYAPSVDVSGLNILWAYTENHQDHGGKSIVIDDTSD